MITPSVTVVLSPAESDTRAAGVETDIICPVCLEDAGEYTRLRWHEYGEYTCSCGDCERGYTPAELAHALSNLAVAYRKQIDDAYDLSMELENLRDMRRALERCLAATRTRENSDVNP